MKKVFVLLFVTLLAGCAVPRYSGVAIGPIMQSSSPEVVVVNDSDTRAGFQQAMESWLSANDISYSTAEESSTPDLDSITLKYEGHWNWDLAIYMSDAYIEAFHEGRSIARVEYTTKYTISPKKFGNAETRIGEMMNILFGKITAEQATKEMK